jgi:uncharacterized protein (TIGR02271 family)
MNEHDPKQVISLAAERLRIRKRWRRTGRVVVRVRPVAEEQAFDIPVAGEHVDIERVPVDRWIDAPEGVRQEGDVTIIPVVEEVLVVEKRLRVREEIRIRRIRSERREHVTAVLRREEADVSRVAESGTPRTGRGR